MLAPNRIALMAPQLLTSTEYCITQATIAHTQRAPVTLSTTIDTKCRVARRAIPFFLTNPRGRKAQSKIMTTKFLNADQQKLRLKIFVVGKALKGLIPMSVPLSTLCKNCDGQDLEQARGSTRRYSSSAGVTGLNRESSPEDREPGASVGSPSASKAVWPATTASSQQRVHQIGPPALRPAVGKNDREQTGQGSGDSFATTSASNSSQILSATERSPAPF